MTTSKLKHGSLTLFSIMGSVRVPAHPIQEHWTRHDFPTGEVRSFKRVPLKGQRQESLVASSKSARTSWKHPREGSSEGLDSDATRANHVHDTSRCSHFSWASNSLRTAGLVEVPQTKVSWQATLSMKCRQGLRARNCCHACLPPPQHNTQLDLLNASWMSPTPAPGHEERWQRRTWA